MCKSESLGWGVGWVRTVYEAGGVRVNEEPSEVHRLTVGMSCEVGQRNIDCVMTKVFKGGGSNRKKKTV